MRFYERQLTAKAYSCKDIGSMVLVDLGAVFPDQLLKLAVKGDAKAVVVDQDGKIVRLAGR